VANSDFQFNIAKGAIKTYFSNVDTNSPTDSEILVVLLELSGLEPDETLKDYVDLASLLAAANNEQTTMGRKHLVDTDVTVTLTHSTSNWLTITLAGSITYTAATGNTVGKLLLCYEPDSTPGSADSAIIPLLAYDVDIIPDGTDVVISAHANGLIRVT
jgi:hypothetical protein